MLIYHYNPNSYEYIGSSQATLDVESTKLDGKPVYFIPRYSTDIPPLEPKEGYTVGFINDGWQYFEDHRGETVYEKTTLRPVVIDKLGPISSLYLKQLPERDNKYQSWLGTGLGYTDDIESFRKIILQDAQTSYTNKSDTYYKVNNKFSINTKLFQTYSNLYISMKADLEDGTLDEKYYITVYNNKTGMAELLQIKSIEEFQEYYRVVRKKYKEQARSYQQLLTDIENAQTCEQMVSILQSYDPEIIKIKES